MRKLVLWIGLLFIISCSELGDFFKNEDCVSNLDCKSEEICKNGECEESTDSNDIDDDSDDEDESDENEDEEMNSNYGEMESHKLGQNCMDCHAIGGTGDGFFTIAGSIYENDLINPNPNLTIKIYSEINGGGELIKTINGDGLGNFYSTDSIEFVNGVYPAITDGNSIKYMPQLTTTGSCNSCHNTTTTSKLFFP